MRHKAVAHTHLSGMEVDIVAMFIEKAMKRLQMNILGKIVAFDAEQLTALRDRSRSCTLCRELVEEAQAYIKIHGVGPGVSKMKVTREMAEKLKRGEISIEDVMFTRDT